MFSLRKPPSACRKKSNDSHPWSSSSRRLRQRAIETRKLSYKSATTITIADPETQIIITVTMTLFHGTLGMLRPIAPQRQPARSTHKLQPSLTKCRRLQTRLQSLSTTTWTTMPVWMHKRISILPSKRLQQQSPGPQSSRNYPQQLTTLPAKPKPSRMLPIFAPTNSLNRMTFLSDPPTENAPDTSVTTVPAPPDHTETEPTSLFHRSHSPSTSTFPGRSTHRHVRRPSMPAPPQKTVDAPTGSLWRIAAAHGQPLPPLAPQSANPGTQPSN